MKPNNTKWIVLAVVAAVVGAFLGPIMMESLSGGMAIVVFGLLFVGIIAFLIWSLSANKIGKPASAAALANARLLAATPGTARIYVVRRGFMGGMAGMKVTIDGVATGQIRMNQFVMAEVSPGTYAVETAMARDGVKPSRSESSLTLQSGEIAVILVRLQMEAMHATTDQQRILGSEAKGEIASAKMVKWADDAG